MDRLDQLVSHQVAAQRHADSLGRLHDEQVSAAYDAAQATVRRVNLGNVRERVRLEVLLDIIQGAYAQRYRAARARLVSALREYVTEEAEFQARVYDAPLTGSQLWEHMKGEPVNGATLTELLDNFEADVLREIRRTLREGWTNGESTRELAARLD